MTKKIKKIFPNDETIAPIRFLVLDVDGVMTDGTITYSSDGAELKSFNVKDGSGIVYWQRAGHGVGIITGLSSPMVLRRAESLEIKLVEMGAKNKAEAFERMLAAAGVKPEETAVIGDDLLDIPMMVRAGLGISVADGVPEVKEVAAYVTKTKGGRGAVREAIEAILKAQGRWEAILRRYLGDARG